MAKRRSTNAQECVYLLHFMQPFGHAQHYLGWTDNLDKRLAAHLAGTGANLLSVIRDPSRGFVTEPRAVVVSRVWPDATRTVEAALKRGGSRKRYCPLCCVRPRGSTPGARRLKAQHAAEEATPCPF